MFIAGFQAGFMCLYRVDKKNGQNMFTPDRLHASSPPSDVSISRKPVTRILWGNSPLGAKGPGYLIVAGGYSNEDPNGISIIWQSGNVKPDMWDEKLACSVILPTGNIFYLFLYVSIYR